MGFPIESSPDDYIRLNGKGRMYLSDVGGLLPGRYIGEIDGLSANVATNKDTLATNAFASGAIIVNRFRNFEGGLTYGMREGSLENYRLALLGGAKAVANQAAGSLVANDQLMLLNEFREIGVINPFITKLDHGAITGGGDNAWALGEVVTASGGATGIIRWIGATYILVTNITGVWVAGEIMSTPDTDVATLTGVATQRDVLLGDDSVPTTKFVLGTDYDLDTTGYIRMLLAGPPATSKLWADHLAWDKEEFEALATGSVEKQLLFTSDIDEAGPHFRILFRKVSIELNGDIQLVGEGESAIPINSTIIADTTQPVGQQFFKYEQFKAA